MLTAENFFNSFKNKSINISADKTIPWVGAGLGIIIGVTIVIADCLFTYRPTVGY